MAKTQPIKKIAPPDDWKKKVIKGQGLNLRDIEVRADKAIETLQVDYIPLIRQELAVIDDAIAKARSKSAAEREEVLLNVHRVAHDIRGQAGTFGYQLITTIGGSLCSYIEDAEGMDSIQLKVIEIHADAMRAVVAGDIRGDGGKTGRQLLASMKQMVGKTLAAQGGQDESGAPVAEKVKSAAG